MMDCPKCGFSQPKDQFCANCGLNLEQFKPAPRPFYEAWASNPYVIVTCCLFIVAATFYYLKMQSPSDAGSNSQTITRDETFTEEQRTSRERELAERQQRRQFIQSTSAQSSEVPAENSESLSGETVGLVSAEGESASLTISQSGVAGKKLQVRFFEINQRDLGTLFSQGKVLSETNQSRTLAIENVSNIESLIKNSRSLPGTKTFTPAAGKNGEIFFENSERKGGVSWEFNLTLAFGQIKEDTITYQIGGDFLYSTPDKSAAPLEMALETHSLRADSAIAIAGWLPHNVSGEPALFEGADNPIKILGSPEFRESLTEFLILVQLK